ncbi:MAG: DUF433 domain-containing protein [bacterium]|nr:DUF433 domain-containing protein [bacterium]
MEKWEKRICTDPEIMVGKPVIKGTRITIDFIIELLAHGWTQEQILENYPRLKKEDITAALEYSAQALKLETMYSF